MSDSAVLAGFEVRRVCAERAAAVREEPEGTWTDDALARTLPTPPTPLRSPDAHTAFMLDPAESRSDAIRSTVPGLESGLLQFLLVASLALNFVMAAHFCFPTAFTLRGELDTDGDGIPDRNDFCPQNLAHSASSSLRWVSNRANDFDGDGCEDGVEDQDRDNDGIWDAEDKCPNTPQHLGFVSNTDTDPEHDGCADRIEDKGIFEDPTPSARRWLKEKCRELEAEDTQSQWSSMLPNVLLGATLAWLLQQGYMGLSRLSQAPRSAGDGAKTAQNIGSRLLLYVVLFAAFYSFERYRRAQR